jgi:hypothetical protein
VVVLLTSKSRRRIMGALNRGPTCEEALSPRPGAFRID